MYFTSALSLSVVQPPVVRLPEVNDVDVGLVYGANVSDAGCNSQGNRAVNTGHSDTVSGLYTIHQVPVGVQDNVVRGLT